MDLHRFSGELDDLLCPFWRWASQDIAKATTEDGPKEGQSRCRKRAAASTLTTQHATHREVEGHEVALIVATQRAGVEHRDGSFKFKDPQEEGRGNKKSVSRGVIEYPKGFGQGGEQRGVWMLVLAHLINDLE
jgi:hypothetical protein